MRPDYEVVAKRWEHGWELHIEDVGVTQSHSLADAKKMAREYIALTLDVSEDSFDVHLRPEVGDGLDDAVAQARAKIDAAADAQQEAARSSRWVARKLRSKGLSGKDTAVVLGISPQRVSQLAPASGRFPRRRVPASGAGSKKAAGDQ